MVNLKKLAKTWFSLMLFALMLFAVSQSALAANTSNGVEFTISPVKSSYELGETAQFNITLRNTNSHSVFVENLNLGLPDYMTSQILSQIPAKLAANETVTTNTSANFTFESTKTVTLNNQNIAVKILSSFDTIEPNSTFSAEIVKSNSKNLLSLSASKADGKAYNSLGGYAKIFVQIPDGWTADQMKSIITSPQSASIFEASAETIDGINYLTFKTNYFGANLPTGDLTKNSLLVIATLAAIALLICLIFIKKLRQALLSLALCFGLLASFSIFNKNNTLAADAPSTGNIFVFRDFNKSGFKNVEKTITNGITTSSYQDGKNWAFNESNSTDTTVADVFFVGPTIYTGADNLSITDEKNKAYIKGAVAIQRSIYGNSDYTPANLKRRFFAPHYRQCGFKGHLAANSAELLSVAFSDVKDAFEFYMANYNNGRPIILAGFSQGSDMCIRLLKECFNTDARKKQLVACYAIGWHYSSDDVTACGFNAATGANDTGVVISFNSEEDGKTVANSHMVPSTVQNKTLCINPLNWSTAKGSANKVESKDESVFFNATTGALLTLPSGTDTSISAYIDENRNTLKVKTNVLNTKIATQAGTKTIKELCGGIFDVFTDGVLHLYDYQFFYKKLLENASVRLAAYLAKLK